jgi:hypothetical protein
MNKKAYILCATTSFISIALFGATPAGDDFLAKSRDEGIDAAIYSFEKKGDTVVQLDVAFSGNWSEDEITLIEENANIAVAKKRVSFVGLSKGNSTYFDIAFVKDEQGAIRPASYVRAKSNQTEDIADVCY